MDYIEKQLRSYKKAYDYVTKNRYKVSDNLSMEVIVNYKEKIIDLRQDKLELISFLLFSLFTYSLILCAYLFFDFSNTYAISGTLLLQTLFSFKLSRKYNRERLRNFLIFFTIGTFIVNILLNQTIIPLLIGFLLSVISLFLILTSLIENIMEINSYKRTIADLKESFKKNSQLKKAMKDLQRMEKDFRENPEFKLEFINYNTPKELQEISKYIHNIIFYELTTDKRKLLNYLRVKNNKEIIVNT